MKKINENNKNLADLLILIEKSVKFAYFQENLNNAFGIAKKQGKLNKNDLKSYILFLAI